MENCYICSKKNLWSSTGRTKDGRREWKCRNCGHEQLEVPPQGLKIPANILYFDIETSLITVKQTVWALKNYNPYIDFKDIEADQYIICWAGAWVQGDSVKVFGECVTEKEAKARNDKRIIKVLRDAVDKADYIVGHNMRPYDWKTVNTRILVNGIPAPAEPKIIDTLSLGRRKFRATSQKLEYWSKMLGGNPKDKMKREDWEAIQDTGDPKSLRKMFKYCKGDIREGANIFIKFKKFIEDSTGKALCK